MEREQMMEEVSMKWTFYGSLLQAVRKNEKKSFLNS